MNTRGSQKDNKIGMALALFAAVLIQGCSSERHDTLFGPAAPVEGAAAVLPASLVEPSSVSESIDGSVGGRVANGRFTLTVPAGAFEGTRTITVAFSGMDELQCELYPEGLQFSVPATLAINLSGTHLDNDRTTVAWYDPESAGWVDMNGTFDAASHSVRAALPHFSIYRGIRAGW